MKILIFTLLLFFLPIVLHSNVIGIDTQNFNPTPSGLDFVTVHPSRTLNPGIINLGYYLNYAVNTLPQYKDSTTQTRSNFEDELLSGDLNIAYGLMKGWHIGLSLPHVISQTIKTDSARSEFKSNGLTEVRLLTKHQLFGNINWGFAFIGSVELPLVKENPFTGNDPGPITNLELASDFKVGRYLLAFNLGYRIRSKGDQIEEVPIEPMSNQTLLSVGLSRYLPDWDTKLIGEIYTSYPIESSENQSNRERSNAELLLGAKHDINQNLAWHIGLGTEIAHGTATPDWRIYSGLNYAFGPKPQTVVYDESFFRYQPIQSEETITMKDVLFEFNSDRFKPAFNNFLKGLVAHANKPPGFVSIKIEGHTDSVGSAAYNLDLSQRRAKSVMNVLTKEFNVPIRKINAFGYGESRPIADNSNYQGRQLNRRVEIKIYRK